MSLLVHVWIHVGKELDPNPFLGSLILLIAIGKKIVQAIRT